MLRVVRHLEVPLELESAAQWYEERRPGLGRDFLDEYQATLARILREPGRWRKIRRNNRKLNFYRFPYAIVYSIQGDEIYVKAVMHLRRRPFYWSGR